MADTPVPIRVTARLLEKIQKAVRETGESQQYIMRLAMDVGLKDLERTDYDVAGAVLKAADAIASPSLPLTVLADEPAEYVTSKAAKKTGLQKKSGKGK